MGTELDKYVSTEAHMRARQQHLKETEEREKREREHNVTPFVQLAHSEIGNARLLAKRAPAAFQVLMLFIEKMDRQNAVMCSQTVLAKITGYALPTIKKAIALLAKERWIQIAKIGTANSYILNSKLVWQATRIGRLAVFNATIIASEEEQPYKIEDWDGVELKKMPILYTGEQAILAGPENDQKDLDI